MDRNKVGLYQEFIERFAFDDAVFPELLIGDVRVVCNDSHADAFQFPGYYGAYPAKADYSCRLVLELVAYEQVPPELASPCSRVCLRDVPEQAEGVPDGQFSCRHYVAFRCVYDYYPLPGAGAHIYVIYAVSGPAHNFQVFGPFEQFGVHLRDAPDDDGVIVFDHAEQFIRGNAVPDIHIVASVLQVLDTFFRDPFRYDYFHL